MFQEIDIEVTHFNYFAILILFWKYNIQNDSGIRVFRWPIAKTTMGFDFGNNREDAYSRSGGIGEDACSRTGGIFIRDTALDTAYSL